MKHTSTRSRYDEFVRREAEILYRIDDIERRMAWVSPANRARLRQRRDELNAARYALDSEFSDVCDLAMRPGD